MTIGGCPSLFAICARPLILLEYQSAKSFRGCVPLSICHTIETLAADFSQLCAILRGLIKPYRLAERLVISNYPTRSINVPATVRTLEPITTNTDFFEICARLAMDEETERIFHSLSDMECHELVVERHSVVQCRIHELGMAQIKEKLHRARERISGEEWADTRRDALESGALANVFYEKVAIDCAKSGFLDAFLRSLSKIDDLEDVILPQCVLEAIRHGQYHVANRIACCPNYDRAFYRVFPDGRVPARFFATLIDGDLVRDGENIASALLAYLPRYDVERLRRSILNDQAIAKSGALQKFDVMYSAFLDYRDYPYDAEY